MIGTVVAAMPGQVALLALPTAVPAHARLGLDGGRPLWHLHRTDSAEGPAIMKPCKTLGLAALGFLAGCGTTRMTDTQRTATEQLLLSNAIDQAVGRIDVRSLAGKPVFLDVQYLDGVVDRGYLISSLRQHLLANGCALREDRASADYVVEARAGGIGTDRHSLLVGVPQTTMPALLPGQPTQIPEIPFAKKTDQNGVAKVALFAYNRRTGHPVWQSGLVQSLSTSHDLWVLGAGPFENGTIRQRTGFAGEPLPVPHLPGKAAAAEASAPLVPLGQAAAWPEKNSDDVSATLAALARALGGGVGPPPKEAAAPKAAKPTNSGTPNAGGAAETQPRQTVISGLGIASDH
jgi:hypothetical protein